ncbi:hypothetical protein TA3x_000437 [Tundrisphaera sp. TA3]|uniref:hypothetical protein n=1 Tax=Tundrisphaera sp. TA3 TaxID=3435775 RepID=UPI003EB8C4EE
MKEDPLQVAREFLPGFDIATNTIDGRWHPLDEIMRKTNRAIVRHNRIQREMGKPERPQVAHNPSWLYVRQLPARYAEGAEPQVGWGNNRIPQMD